jgi:hypothetical protein
MLSQVVFARKSGAGGNDIPGSKKPNENGQASGKGGDGGNLQLPPFNVVSL